MKKILAICFIFVMVLCVAIFTYPSGGEPDTSYYDNDGGSAGGGTLWIRIDENCNDPNNPGKEKTTCSSGGSQQCTAQYCN